MLDFVNNAVRAQLDHPVIDVDGHMIEFMPVFFDFLKQVAGQDMVDRLWAAYTKADTLNFMNGPRSNNFIPLPSLRTTALLFLPTKC